MFLLLTVGFVLQDFLKKYSGIVEDLQDIRCRKADGDKNSNKKVRFLDLLESFYSTNTYRRTSRTHPVLSINAVEMKYTGVYGLVL